MELIPIEDLERWPVKVIAFFVSIRHSFPAPPYPHFYFIKCCQVMSLACVLLTFK